MATPEEQARLILHALESKPDVFYEVLRQAQDSYSVLSPWLPDGFGFHRRLPNTGENGEFFIIAAVVPKHVLSVLTWSWYGNTESGTCSTEVEAKALADANLRKNGVILA